MTKADLENKIKELEDKLTKYKQWLVESEERYNKLVDEKEKQLELLPSYQQMKKENEHLLLVKKMNEDTIVHKESKIQLLEQKNMELQESIKNNAIINDTVHNARGAGRKPKPEEKIQEQLQCLDKLLNDGKKEKEICRLMQISRVTYYRLKKVWKEKYH